MHQEFRSLPLRRGWRFIILPGLLAALFALASVLPARAGTVTNLTIPISETQLNPCNGELVSFKGTDHFTFRYTADGSGGLHLGANFNVHVTGTGDQGNTYVGNEVIVSSYNSSVGVEQTEIHTFSAISQGPAPNFLMHEVLHFTLNPDGTVTSSVDHFTATCGG